MAKPRKNKLKEELDRYKRSYKLLLAEKDQLIAEKDSVKQALREFLNLVPSATTSDGWE